VYAGLFDGTEKGNLEVAAGRRIYVHVARGKITANGEALAAGDALKLTDTIALSLSGGSGAEVLVFDLPG
jgi:redox-sensitive bicupin YhaK (pirin superfamily)